MELVTYRHKGIVAVTTPQSYELMLSMELSINKHTSESGVIDWFEWRDACLPFIQQGGRIYTFVEATRIGRMPLQAGRYFTGSFDNWATFCDKLEPSLENLPFHVPFSHGGPQMKWESYFATSIFDLLDLGYEADTMTIY